MLGSLVAIRGLQSSPELNDEVGVIVGVDTSSGRLVVKLLQGGDLKSLLPDNLFLLKNPAHGAASSGGAGTSKAESGGSAGSSAPPPQSGEDKAEGDEDARWAPGGDEAEMAETFKTCMPLFHDALWSATVLDVETTLSNVTRKVLRDMSVEKAARRRRADALLRLGRIFQEPLLEQRRTSRGAHAAPAVEAGSSEGGEAAGSAAPCGGPPARRGALARLRPRVPWRRRASSGTGKEAERKRQLLEGALAMMAAGATTEEVDEMVAARAAMDAEFGAEGGA